MQEHLLKLLPSKRVRAHLGSCSGSLPNAACVVLGPCDDEVSLVIEGTAEDLILMALQNLHKFHMDKACICLLPCKPEPRMRREIYIGKLLASYAQQDSHEPMLHAWVHPSADFWSAATPFHEHSCRLVPQRQCSAQVPGAFLPWRNQHRPFVFSTGPRCPPAMAQSTQGTLQGACSSRPQAC